MANTDDFPENVNWSTTAWATLIPPSLRNLDAGISVPVMRYQVARLQAECPTLKTHGILIVSPTEDEFMSDDVLKPDSTSRMKDVLAIMDNAIHEAIKGQQDIYRRSHQANPL